MSYINKIDASLLNRVSAESADNKIDCLIYSNNFYQTKKCLQNSECKILKEYPFINAFGVNIFPKNLSFFARINSVEYITSQTKVFCQVNIAKKVANIKQLYSENLFGNDTTICFIDTGIFPHLDFVCPNNRIVIFKDFINDKIYPYDDNGHGTFISGVASGNGLVSGGKYAGLAPKSNIISLKALDKNGETGTFKILEAMQWVYDNKEKYNIKVVCMSFGSTPLEENDPLLLGAETLWNSGIVVVAAAGNSGPSAESIKSPGTSSRIITVGALYDARNKENPTEKDYRVAEFSSRGPANNRFKPDLITSGVELHSTSNIPEKKYCLMSGTSVSTPIVAGLSALIIEKYPNIAPIELKGLVMRETENLKGFSRNEQGTGYLKIH